MEDGSIELTQLTHRMNIEYVSDLIIGMHQADQGLFGAGSQLLLQVFQVYMTIGQTG